MGFGAIANRARQQADALRAPAPTTAQSTPNSLYANDYDMISAASRGEGYFSGLSQFDRDWLLKMNQAPERRTQNQFTGYDSNLANSGLNVENVGIMERLQAAGRAGRDYSTSNVEVSPIGNTPVYRPDASVGESPLGGYIRPPATITPHTGYTEDSEGRKTPTGGGANMGRELPADLRELNFSRPDLQPVSATAPQLAVGPAPTAPRINTTPTTAQAGRQALARASALRGTSNG